MDGDWRALHHAETLLGLQRNAEAEQRFRDVLAQDPESVRALLGLGRALDRQERYDEAEHVVRSALRLDPEDEAGYHLLTDVLCGKRDGEGALVAAHRGLQLAPHDASSHYQYARALLALRRPRVRDAYDAARRAVAIAPHSADCHNLVGLCLAGLGNPEGAERAYRNALALDPHHTLAQNNLAATELERRRLGRAAGLLRRAVSQAPQEKLLHENLDAILLILAHRVIWSSLAVALALSILVANGVPWWWRALTGVGYVVTLGVVLRPLRRELPRGVLGWAPGIFRRSEWPGRVLIGALVFVSAGVFLLSFAPGGVAGAAGILLFSALQVVGLGCVIGWVVMAAVNLARGR